jgi:glycosyltransferase involved in cell wall biosynthesis
VFDDHAHHHGLLPEAERNTSLHPAGSERSISVVIPTYNRCDLVMNAVESVLSQKVKGVDVVVIDDGSTDDTRELFKQPRLGVRYIYQQNSGVSAARNRGVVESSGNLIAFLDSDDIWAPGKLQAQADLVTSDAVISFQGVGWFVDAEEDAPLLEQVSQVIWPRRDADGFVSDAVLDVAEGRYFHLGTMLCTRAAFAHVGFFDPSLCMGEDEDWFSRASLIKRFHYDPRPLLQRRFHGNQTPSDSEKSLRSLVTVFERIAERTTSRHQRASRVAIKRLAAKLSHLANYLNAQQRRQEAVGALKKAYWLAPLNLSRLAKLVLFAAKNCLPRRHAS